MDESKQKHLKKLIVGFLFSGYYECSSYYTSETYGHDSFSLSQDGLIAPLQRYLRKVEKNSALIEEIVDILNTLADEKVITMRFDSSSAHDCDIIVTLDKSAVKA